MKAFLMIGIFNTSEACMKVVILAGGFGTRIRDVADNIPKPMIPIGDMPILWHIMKYYSYFGHKDFVLCLGYKSETIIDFFMNIEKVSKDFTLDLKNGKVINHGIRPAEDWTITFANTGLHSMTGARIKKIKNYINDDTFLLTYGDGVGDIDINESIKFHKNHGKVLTVTGVRPPGRFGELGCDSEGAVVEFNEKPQATGGRISGGYFVVNKKIFDYLSDDESLVFEQEPMKSLVRDRNLMVFEHDGFWQPMDTSREYQLLNEIYTTGEAPWKR